MPKNINEEAQIHAKVDGKNVIISEATIRRDLKFEDEGGIYCLSNEVIFEQLPLMGDPTTNVEDEALNEENVPTQSNDPPLSRVNILGSGEDILKIKELMEICTKLQQRVIDLENTKTVQAKEISSLKRRGRYNDEEMFDTNVLNDKEVVVEDVNDASIATAVTATATTAASINDITLAQALVEIKTSKPKERAQLIEDENLARDNVQAMMDADYELAARLQEEEQGELTIEEKSRLFVELMDKRKKHFAKLRAEKQRRKPPTKAQKKNQIADKKSQMYYTFSKMLKNFDKDLEVLWRLVKDRFIKSKLLDNMDSFVLHTLKTMSKHHIEDTVWKSQQGLTKVKS
nr:hypothetical protein [Tanacetum cinerariifolium]